MATRIAISGFGRIGRNVLRAIVEAKRPDVEVVAINDLVSAKDNAHLFKHDSVHGPFPGPIKVEADSIDVGTGPIKVLAERDPKKLPWKAMGIDIVMECTGIFTDREKAAQHLEAGAKRVLVSAPAKGADLTVVYGVNHGKLTAGARLGYAQNVAARPERVFATSSLAETAIESLECLLPSFIGTRRGQQVKGQAMRSVQRHGAFAVLNQQIGGAARPKTPCTRQDRVHVVPPLGEGGISGGDVRLEGGRPLLDWAERPAARERNLGDNVCRHQSNAELREFSRNVFGVKRR
jgi:hypothetical protein